MFNVGGSLFLGFGNDGEQPYLLGVEHLQFWGE